MPLSDTSPAATRVQMQIEGAMSGVTRILQALEASRLVREFAKAKVRSDHPEWSAAQGARDVLRLQFLPGELPSGLP